MVSLLPATPFLIKAWEDRKYFKIINRFRNKDGVTAKETSVFLDTGSLAREGAWGSASFLLSGQPTFSELAFIC